MVRDIRPHHNLGPEICLVNQWLTHVVNLLNFPARITTPSLMRRICQRARTKKLAAATATMKLVQLQNLNHIGQDEIEQPTNKKPFIDVVTNSHPKIT